MSAAVPPSARQVVRAAVVASVLSGAPSTLHALVSGGDVLASTRAAGTLLPGRRDPPGVVARAVAPGGNTGVGGGHAAPDLGVVAPRRAPAIAALPQGPQWADHLAFGALVGACLSERSR